MIIYDWAKTSIIPLLTSAKIYIGSDSTKNYPANMILHELLLFESASNDILATSAIISTYLTTRHSLTTYNDTSKVSPYSDPYEAYLATGSLRLFTGDYGNTTGTYWLTYNGVLITDNNRFNGQCGSLHIKLARVCPSVCLTLIFFENKS